MKTMLTAGAMALALQNCALALDIADQTALNGVWVLAQDDPRRSGEMAAFYENYSMTLNFGIGNGYLAEGISPSYGWTALTDVTKTGAAVEFTLPMPAANGPIKITALGAERAVLVRDGEAMTMERSQRGEMPTPPEWFEAVALRLTQGSDEPRRFSAMTTAGEDQAAACADETRASVEFDLLSPISRSIFVKRDFDITGYGINEIDFDAATGTATVKVAQLVQSPPPEETWTITGLDKAGTIRVSPMGSSFADCTGPVK